MIACSLLIAATLAHQTGVPSVEVTDAAIIHESNGFWTIEASMTNRADQAVTAWAIHWTIRFADGTSQGGGFGVDGILRYAGLLPPRDQKVVVPPRSMIRVRDSVSLPQKNDVAVLGVSALSLTYAILADDSWIGDQRQVLDIFQRRGQNADDIAFILPILRDAQKDGATSEAFGMALARLDASAHFGFDSGEMQVTRTNLKLFLDERINVTGDRFLQNQIDSLAARLAVYEAHRRPKSSVAGR